MKENIHPQYGKCVVRCVCGETFETGSTKKEKKVDICWLAFIGLGIYEIIPGFIAGLIAAIVVTLIDKEPSKEVQDLYDYASSGSIE